MPTMQKEFSFGGVDYRSTHINRPENKARDLRNVYLNSQKKLRKRPGFDEVGWTPVTVGDKVGNLYPVIYRQSAYAQPVRNFLVMEKDPFLTTSATKIYDPINNTFTQVYGSYNGYLTIINNAKPAYYNNVTYFASTGGGAANGGIAKFDGYDFYDSGMGPDSITYVGAGATSRYIRTVLAHLDGQGNWVYGDYQEALRTYNVTYTIADSVPTVCNAHQIYAAIVNGNQTPVPNGSGDVTITVDSGHNLQVLMWVIVRADANGIIMAQVKARTNTSVTFDGTNPRIYAVDGFGNVTWSSYGGGLGLTYTDNTKFARSLRLVYQSAGATATDFNFITYFVVGSTSASNAITVTPASPTAIPAWAPWDNDFEDFYDEEVVKGWVGSYEIKSITVYNNVLVACDQDQVYFSDLSLGSSVENFAPFDNFTVGSSEYGAIVGVFATESSLIVHRQYESYYISGNIVTGNYRVQPMNTTQIGLIGAGTPLRFEGGEFFLSARGVYYASYSNAKELSEDIEPVFTDLLLGSLAFTSSYTSVNYAEEYIMLTMPDLLTVANSKVAVFSYKWKEWFIWDLPAIQMEYFRDSSGNVKLIYSNEDGIYVQNASNDDDGVAINSYWASTYFHAGEPSLEKSFIRINVFSTEDSTAFDVDVTSVSDWNTTQVTSFTSEITASKRAFGNDLAGNRCLSHSIKFGNNVAGEALDLVGFVLDYEMVQKVSKIK